MTTPTQADAMAALDLYLEKASGHSCKQCPAPTDDDLSSAIRAAETIRAYIEGKKPVDVDTLKEDVTSSALRGDILVINLQDIDVIVDHLSAKGFLHSPDKIILNREDVPKGLEEALSGNDIHNTKHNNIIYQTAALLAKDEGA